MNTPTPLQSIPPQYPTPAYPQGYLQVNRTAGPVKIFGIIYAILAALSVFGFFAMVALAFMPGFMGQQYGANDAISAAAPKIFFGFIAVIVGISLVLHALTAYGLLAVKSWGRTLAIVTAIISLISIPIGTILGGLTLYFLMRRGADQEYARLVYERNQYPGIPQPGSSF